MTYEWGWIGGRPMAVAPINEVRKVLDYAVSVIPRQKIIMGMLLYGYDWKIPWKYGTWANVIGPREAVNNAAKNGAAIANSHSYCSLMASIRIGYITVQIVIDRQETKIPALLRQKGFGVTSWLAEEREGNRIVMQVLAKRTNEKELLNTIQLKKWYQ